MKKTPLVSIILPTCNGQKYIRNSIMSIVSQTYKNWELIIVNDCSTDSTPKIIEEFKNADPRIKIINNSTNQKLPKSLNIGFSCARGDLFTWTSDDNLYYPNAIDEMVRHFASDPDLGFIFCAQEIIDEHGNTIESFAPKYKFADLVYKNICGACFMYTQKAAKSAGYYNDNLFCAEDYDYFCRLALNTKTIYYPKILYRYRKHPDNLSATRVELADKNANAVRLKYANKLIAKYKPNYFDVQYIYYKLFKHTEEKEYAIKAILTNPINLIKILIWKIKLLKK